MSYIEEAKKRARNRLKSPWTIPLRVVSFILMIVTGVILGYIVWKLHLVNYPSDTLKDLDGSFLPLGIFLPLIFASIPIGFLSGNLIAYLIPPVRKSLNMIENYSKSQKSMLQAVKYFSLPLILISIIFSVI